MRNVDTFYSHFGAVRFRRLCRDRGVACELAPVSRSLSRSCGTRALFEASPLVADESWPEEIELVVRAVGGGVTVTYEEVYRAEGG
jgi:hypothetical protein